MSRQPGAMEFGINRDDINAGYMVDDSDLEFSECSNSESSGDEESTVESTTGFSNRSCKTHPKTGQQSDSDDEFEQEMDKELMAKIELLVPSSMSQAVSVTPKKDAEQSEVGLEDSSVKSEGEQGLHHPDDAGNDYYDKIYFDSSDSGDEGEENAGTASASGQSSTKKIRKLTNDELFYDPDMDDKDERWINRQRMVYHNVNISRSLEKEKKKRVDMWNLSSEGTSSQDESNITNDTGKTVQLGSKSDKGATQAEPTLPKSAAVLNCPACMTTLCLDCQRHDKYVNQFRAMFVLNCLIVRDEVLTYKPKASTRSQRKRKRGKLEEAPEEQGTYHPVRCRECNTEVAVYDQDEVFHFFNVIASVS